MFYDPVTSKNKSSKYWPSTLVRYQAYLPELYIHEASMIFTESSVVLWEMRLIIYIEYVNQYKYYT